MATTYLEADNKTSTAADGIDYAYRESARATRRWCCCSISAATSTTGTRP